MRLLNTLRLLVRTGSPDTGVAPGAVYFDNECHEPRYFNGARWMSFGDIGFPHDADGYVVPDGRQVMYFEIHNNGVLTILGDGVLVGIR